MDLLEVTNTLVAHTRITKEELVRLGSPASCECGHDEYLNRVVMVIRDGSDTPEAGVVVEEDGMRAGCLLATDLLAADTLALTFDGKNRETGRKEFVVITGDRTGELMWKVQPYETAGDVVCWGEAEVPDELPLYADSARRSTVENSLRDMLKTPPSTIPFMYAMPPEIAAQGPEAVRAMLDLMVAAAVPHTAAANVIEQTQLYANACSLRAKIIMEHRHMFPSTSLEFG